MLRYAFQIDPAEQVRASRAVQRRTRLGRLFDRVFWPIMGVMALFWGVTTGWTSAPLMWFASVMLLTAVLTAGAPWWQRRAVRRALAQAPVSQGEQVYEISEVGLRISSALGTTQLQWQALIEIAETKEFFLLYFARHCAYYLPKRVVGTSPEQERLRSFMQRIVGAKARGLAQVDPAPAT